MFDINIKHANIFPPLDCEVGIWVLIIFTVVIFDHTKIMSPSDSNAIKCTIFSPIGHELSVPVLILQYLPEKWKISIPGLQ